MVRAVVERHGTGFSIQLNTTPGDTFSDPANHSSVERSFGFQVILYASKAQHHIGIHTIMPGSTEGRNATAIVGDCRCPAALFQDVQAGLVIAGSFPEIIRWKRGAGSLFHSGRNTAKKDAGAQKDG